MQKIPLDEVGEAATSANTGGERASLTGLVGEEGRRMTVADKTDDCTGVEVGTDEDVIGGRIVGDYGEGDGGRVRTTAAAAAPATSRVASGWRGDDGTTGGRLLHKVSSNDDEALQPSSMPPADTVTAATGRGRALDEGDEEVERVERGSDGRGDQYDEQQQQHEAEEAEYRSRSGIGTAPAATSSRSFPRPAADEATTASSGSGSVGSVGSNAGDGLKRRQKFLVFVRILFKCLDERAVDHSLMMQAKQIVKECTRNNRDNVEGYESLVDAIQVRLRGVVGEVHWHRAEEYLNRYLVLQRRRQRVEQEARPQPRRSTSRSPPTDGGAERGSRRRSRSRSPRGLRPGMVPMD